MGKDEKEGVTLSETKPDQPVKGQVSERKGNNIGRQQVD